MGTAKNLHAVNEKIIVIGNNGSGKSVFSIKLGKKLNLPVIHLDSLFHKPEWKRPTNEEWDKIQADLVKGEGWIELCWAVGVKRVGQHVRRIWCDDE